MLRPMDTTAGIASARQQLLDANRRLAAWYADEPGLSLFQEEARALEGRLPDVFGYYLLQLGGPAVFASLLSDSRVRWKFYVGVDDAPSGAAVYAEPESLPIASDSIDAVLLPHTLDFSSDPHQLLREVERVLIPEGHLLILGFNPWSLWGLWRILRKRGGQTPWNGQFVSQRRLHDWLSLLGFDIADARGLFRRPPFSSPRLPRIAPRMRLAPGAAYLVHARKRVSTLTPVGPLVRKIGGLIGSGVTEPTP